VNFSIRHLWPATQVDEQSTTGSRKGPLAVKNPHIHQGGGWIATRRNHDQVHQVRLRVNQPMKGKNRTGIRGGR